jgi:hypothetical protein
LVITYDFHPNSTVASFRSLSWLKYFKEFGVEPIILTHSKNFNKQDSNFSKDSNLFSEDKVISSGSEYSGILLS